MHLAVIQFEKEKPSLLRELTLDISDDLSAAQQALAAPCVWVVPNAACTELARFSGLIDDRGVKNKAVELSRVLMHGDRITMADGGFTSAGKLRQSVERFLEKADPSPRLFILGATADVFSRLRNGAEQRHSPVLEPGQASAHPARGAMALRNPAPVPEELQNVFVGNSPEAEEVRQLILRAAAIDWPVLITGDTGTGKEIVAYEIHRNSKRSGGRFMPVNCGALPPGLFESEVFGHVKGAFTNALMTKTGLWKSANNGTLFLDEIGELPLELQAKVLRALQDNRIRPVGGDREEKTDVRVIAATNRELISMVTDNTFRSDLYYRLRGFLIHTPPLREHRGDIALIAGSLWRRITNNNEARLPGDIMKALGEYSWPGNVRELKMVLMQLQGLFGDMESLGERHIHAVFAMQGQELSRIGRKAADAPAADIYAAFNRLRRTYETIRAAQHLLQPGLNGPLADADVYRLREQARILLDELDFLCRYPFSFTPPTLENIKLINSVLSKYSGMLDKDPDQANSYLRETGSQVFETVLALLLQEIDAVLANI